MTDAAEAQPSGAAPAAGAAEPSPPDGIVVRRVDDTVVEEAPFAGGAIDGPVKIYAAEGWLLRTAHFKAGQPHGETVEYGKDGKTMARFTFAEGRLSGPAEIFADGRPTRQMHYLDGVMSGEMRSYDPAGALISVHNFAAGQLHGEARILRPDGSPVRLAHYRNGKLDGEVTDYWDNGKIRQRARYKNGLQDGPTITYLVTGEPDQEITYDKGKPVASKPHAQPQDAPAHPASWLDRLINGA